MFKPSVKAIINDPLYPPLARLPWLTGFVDSLVVY